MSVGEVTDCPNSVWQDELLELKGYLKQTNDRLKTLEGGETGRQSSRTVFCLSHNIACLPAATVCDLVSLKNVEFYEKCRF